MNGLSKQEFDRLEAGTKARKRLLMDGIRRGLERAARAGAGLQASLTPARGNAALSAPSPQASGSLSSSASAR